MPELGAFAPFGMFEFGAGPAPGEASYRSQVRSVEAAFDVSEGTHVEATIYARAMAIASLKATLRHARQQRRPMRAVEMLGALERQYGLSPAPGDSDDTRRRTLAARKRIPRGSSPANLSAVLRDLLGDNFVKVISPEASAWPASPGGYGAWDAPEHAVRFFRCLSGVPYAGTTILGLEIATSASFTYESLLGDGATLAAGDRLTFEIENPTQAESVAILSVDNDAVPMRATGLFRRSHDVGASIRTHAPLWISEKRRITIVVKAAAADDPRTRERIDAEMARQLRGTTQWQIARESSPGVIGPFTIGSSPIGSVPLGTTSIT